MAWLDAAGKDALLEAVRAVEVRSCAELVVVVRARSAGYRQADLVLGALAAYATLGFMLFSPWPFGLAWIFVDPAVVGLLAALATAHVAPLRRVLTPAAQRRAAVRAAACGVFFEKGVGHTRGRTGILVYLSQLERMAEVLADRGVLAAVDPKAWAEAVGGVDAAMARAEGSVAVARRIEALAAILGPCLPRSGDDVNELADEVAG